MEKLGYWIAKIQSKLLHSQEPMLHFYRRGGVKIGKNCLICSNILTKESHLLEIGNNVTISTNVTFITHDNSAKLLFGDRGDLFGKIKVGDNCFIGENSCLLYGVELGNNIIVAAGSVVTKSFDEENIIIGGNPARKISTWEKYQEKYEDKAIRRRDMEKRQNDNFLVRR